MGKDKTLEYADQVLQMQNQEHGVQYRLVVPCETPRAGRALRQRFYNQRYKAQFRLDHSYDEIKVSLRDNDCVVLFELKDSAKVISE